MKIDPDKIREVIGKGGSVIQKITAESGATVDIEDDGTIHIASPNAEACDVAKKMIDTIVFVPQVGELYYGKVVRIIQFGAFVELAPGKDGMVHISKLANHQDGGHHDQGRPVGRLQQLPHGHHRREHLRRVGHHP